MRRAIVLLAMILLAMGGAPLSAQPASIAGTVVDRTTGKPVERVHVSLTNPDSSEAYGAMSDSTGRFSVARISPGRYYLIAERSGYVHESEDARVILKAGQQLTDFHVKMARASMLNGRVVDQYGDPVQRLDVRMVPIPPTKLSPTLTQGDSSQTDDRGEFHMLTGPGKYYLEAMVRLEAKNGPPEARTDGTSETIYGPTYYPNAANRARAAVVEVVAGRDVEGLEIHLAAAASQRLLNVNGMVTGVPEAAPFVMIYLVGGEQGMGAQAYAHQDGKFSVSGLSPGEYVVTATTFPPAKLLLARTKIKLDAGDVTDVELVLREPGEIAGTLEVAGPTERRKVLLQPTGGSPMFGGDEVSGDVAADGSFHIAKVWPDQFRAAVEPLPDTAYVKSVEVDGDAVADNTIEVWGGHVPQVKIAVGLDGAAISGKVLDRDGEPAEGVTVLLLADTKEERARTFASEGKYSFKGIRAGKYRLIAVPPSEDLNIEKLFNAAEEIELKPGDRTVKDLTDAKK